MKVVLIFVSAFIGFAGLLMGCICLTVWGENRRTDGGGPEDWWARSGKFNQS